MRPTTIRGEAPVDPINDDFNRLLIEKRLEIKKENPTLAQFLKTTANGGAAYGMFVQVDPRTEDQEVLVNVFSGNELPFVSITAEIEKGGPWYFPIIGAAVTAGTHLLLALIERLLTDARGFYALLDTDSAAIISTREGGLVPCQGGPHRLLDGRDAVHALSWEEVRAKVVEPLRALNPYCGDAGKESIFKIEDINFGPDGKQRQLFTYSIASKRYSMFVENERGEREIVKASAHGLGFLYPPFEDEERKHPEHQWIWDAWDYILTLELDGPVAARAKRKPYFDLPAMMQVAITTPAVIARFKGQDWARPLNFMLAPLLMGEISNGDEAGATVVTPFTKDRSDWKSAVYRDIATGDSYTLYDEDFSTKPRQLDVMCYGGIIEQHRFHPEAKFCGPDGQPCGPETRGLLQRRHVQIRRKIPIRKEGNRRWQEGEDLSILLNYELEIDSTATEYVRAEDTRHHRSHTVACAQLREWLNNVSLSLVSRIIGIKREHLRAIRDGHPARRKTLTVLEDLRHRWMKAEQSGFLQHAVTAIRSGGW